MNQKKEQHTPGANPPPPPAGPLPHTNAQEDAAMRALLEKNASLSERIMEQNKKIQKRLTLMVVGNYIRLAIIIIPIILGLIYLPALIEPYMEEFQQLLDASGTFSGEPGGFTQLLDAAGGQDIQQILERLGQ